MSKILKITLIILVVIVGVPALALGRFLINDTKTKHNLELSYQQIQLPSNISLKSQTYQNGSIDNASQWTYIYSVSSDRITLYSQFRTALQNAGFNTVDDLIYMDELRANRNGIFIDVGFAPTANGGAPGPLQEVDITVTK